MTSLHDNTPEASASPPSTLSPQPLNDFSAI